MKRAPYIPFYPSDWLAGVADLSPAECGVYVNLLMLIYDGGGPIKADFPRLARRLNCPKSTVKAVCDMLVDTKRLAIQDGMISAPVVDKYVAWSRADEARPAIPQAVRQSVFERDGSACVYCGATAGPFHLDHVMPWSRGGADTVENLVVSCVPCNLAKRDKTITEWLGDVQ